MAREKTSEAKPEKRDPVYVVCRVQDDGTLAVLDGGVSAKTQQIATDKIVGELPVEERVGVFAAFLAGGYREFTYETETKIETKSAERAPSFAVLATGTQA